jgi:PTH1 family peptidyl-tRNA hydrolase
VSDAWVIAGLGNPGPEYAGTRHNIGFAAIHALAERVGGTPKRHKRAHALTLEGTIGLPGAMTSVVLAQPLDYMNRSGGPIKALLAFYDVPVDRLMVVHDDLDLPFDHLRVKFGGGDGGHNGLKSLRSALGTGDYTRVRLGIGRPPGRQDPADYVLKPFTADQRNHLPGFLDRADDAMISVIEHGVEWTQNRFHGSEIGSDDG